MTTRIRSCAILPVLIPLIAVVLVLQTQNATAGPFVNLDFEWSSPTGSFSATTWAWTPFYGGDDFFYNTVPLSIPWVSLHDSLADNGRKPLEGDYSIMLGAATDYSTAPISYPDVWISQTGDVPPDAKSLMFRTDSGGSMYWGRVEVTLDGTVIPMNLYAVDDPVNYDFPVETYIGDISAFSGQQEVELRFTAKGADPPTYGDGSSLYLDAIEFSPIAVPEPSTLALLAIGMLSLLTRVRRRRAHR